MNICSAGTVTNVVTGRSRELGGCGRDFASVEGFDAHFTSRDADHPQAWECRPEAALLAEGWQSADGVWRSPRDLRRRAARGVGEHEAVPVTA